MRIASRDSYCRVATYKYEYDKTCGKPPDKKEVVRMPYTSPEDIKPVNRTIAKKTCEFLYDAMHGHIYDPLLLNMKVYNTASRSCVTYRKYPLFNMIAGVVYVIDNTHYRYHTHPIEFFDDRKIAVIFYPNSSKPMCRIAYGKRYRSEILEDCYSFIDMTILEKKKTNLDTDPVDIVDLEGDQITIPAFE